MLCEKCKGGRCVNKPNINYPIEIACPRCEESGCEHCQLAGSFKLEDCPKKYIDWQLIEAIQLAELFGKGVPPVAGGSLDQAAWFVNLHHVFQYESNKAEAESYKRP